MASAEQRTEVDALMMGPISKLSMLLTVVSILWRFVSICINWSLAYVYWMEESYGYCAWTIGSILVPMVVTSVIYIHTYVTYRDSVYFPRNLQLNDKFVFQFQLEERSCRRKTHPGARGVLKCCDLISLPRCLCPKLCVQILVGQGAG